MGVITQEPSPRGPKFWFLFCPLSSLFSPPTSLRSSCLHLSASAGVFACFFSFAKRNGKHSRQISLNNWAEPKECGRCPTHPSVQPRRRRREERDSIWGLSQSSAAEHWLQPQLRKPSSCHSWRPCSRNFIDTRSSLASLQLVYTEWHQEIKRHERKIAGRF